MLHKFILISIGDRNFLENCAIAIRTLGMQLLVIDSENKYISSGLTQELAQMAAGKYYYLPKTTEQALSTMAKSALKSAVSGK